MTNISELTTTGEILSTRLDICIEIAPDLSEAAQKIAIAENPDNAVVVKSGPDAKTRLALGTDKKWKPGRTLRVRFLDGEPIVQQKVAAIARQWSQHANIRFSFGNDPRAEIRISFQQTGNWSARGTDALLVPQDQPTMNYDSLRPDTRDAEYARVVLHEFGHVLGCIHEHLHPEAGIAWNKEAVYRYYMGPPNN
jgi:serralysin